ncbi:hypothetical protein JCM3770_005088 [Rhodotorula araucariae]
MRPTAGASAHRKEHRGNEAPYRRGVTLGKAMRRGKLDKGGQAVGKMAEDAGARLGAKGKAKAKAPVRGQEPSDGEDDRDGASEEEWKGVGSSSAVDEGSGDDEPAASRPPAPTEGKGRPVPRKAGGTGKKRKVFVEEKNDLLSLATSITGQVEAKKQERLHRAKNKPAVPAKADKNALSEAKQRQLAAARAVVAARSKVNKEKRKAATTPKPVAPAPAGGKKKVSFA